MTAATVVYMLFAVATGALADFTSLGVYEDKATCNAAATKVAEAVADGHGNRIYVCVSSDSLDRLANDNPPPGVDATK